MEKEKIKEIRNHLVSKLGSYTGEPIKLGELGIDKDILEEIVFDTIEGYVGTYRTFAKELMVDELYKMIDYTGISFKNFLCSIDFTSIKGVTLNPQEVFNKSLGNSNLSGVTLDINEDSFNEVLLFNTSFKGAKTKYGSVITINPQKLGSNYMSFCEFDGVKFEGSFKGMNIEYSNFNGSTGAVINPQELDHRSVYDAVLTDVRIDGSFWNINVMRADFTGSIGAVIDPQEVKDKSLYYTTLKDAVVLGKNMSGVQIEGTNFTGHKGTVTINPQTIYHKNFNYSVLADTRILGSTDGCTFIDTSFKGSTGAIIDKTKCFVSDDTDLTDTELVDEKEKIKLLISNAFRNK